jgi:hypothetical protein
MDWDAIEVISGQIPPREVGCETAGLVIALGLVVNP